MYSFNTSAMKKKLCCFGLLFCLTTANAQQNSKTPVKPNVPELKKLLTGSQLPFSMVNDSLAVIPYQGENIASYQVIIQSVSDLYIVFTNLSEAVPGKIDDTKYKYLLQKNDEFDIVKIGMSSDNNILYVRADIYRAGITEFMLTRIIKQVANVTNIIGGDLK